jgi:hypothetical protein
MFKTLLIFLVIAVLMEDSVSIRKTEEEKKEEEELAKAVNRTLAEEEEKKKKEEDEAKIKKLDKEKNKNVKGKVNQKEDQNEAGPSLNCTCPAVKPCRPCQDCPVANCTGQCKACPEVKPCPDLDECPEVEPCGPCPKERPCLPCPSLNRTSLDVECPAPPVCPGDPGLSLPAAIAVGAVTGVLVTGLAAAIGLILRYVDPIASGFIFMATIIFIWYFCSHHPEAAREIGGRAATLLREAAAALSHRISAALQRQQDQVGFS